MCPPPSFKHTPILFLKAWKITFASISGELLISSNLFVIRWRRSSMSTTGVAKMEFFIYGHKKKSQGEISQDLGGHIIGVFKLMIRPSKNSLTKFRFACVVCMRAPSCWKYPCLNSSSSSISMKGVKISKRYRSAVNIPRIRASVNLMSLILSNSYSPSKNMGPISLLLLIAAHTPTFWGCRGFSIK